MYKYKIKIFLPLIIKIASINGVPSKHFFSLCKLIMTVLSVLLLMYCKIYNNLNLQNLQYLESPIQSLQTYSPLMMEPNEISKSLLPWYFKGKHLIS